MMIGKIAGVLYGVGAYVFFLGSLFYLVAFTNNVGPHTVSGPASVPAVYAALVDFGLIFLFGAQHGIMARPAFKAWWTRFVPPYLERSTFVWAASILVVLIVQFWQPVEGTLWNVDGSGRAVLYGISLFGFLLVPVASFLTDHFELFGLQQVFQHAWGREKTEPKFRERAFYKRVRHPMMLAFLIGLWATPHMTVGHLWFAGLMSSYVLVGIYFEERDLARKHGEEYRSYQKRVPKLLPFGEMPATGTAKNQRSSRVA